MPRRGRRGRGTLRPSRAAHARRSPEVRLTHRRLLVAVLFAAFAVVELWTPLVHGQWLLPGDDGQAWLLTHVAKGPAAPHNGLTGDVYEGLAPFLHYDVASVRSGSVPTWNPANGNGQPFLANGQSAVFSPFTSVYYVFGIRIALLASALAKLWLAGFFTFLFLTRHRVHELAAVAAGVTFAYAGYHLVWLDYQDIVSVSALLPLALWLVRVALDNCAATRPDRRRRILALGGLALTVGAMGVSGHPETFLFDGLLVFAYGVTALVSEVRPWRHMAGWALRLGSSGVLGIGLAAAALLPFWLYEGSSTRAVHSRASSAQVVPGFPLDTVPMAAFPDLFGGPQYPYYDRALYSGHERSNYAEVNGVALGLIGVALVPLGFFAVVRGRRSGRTRMLGWFAAAAVVVDGLLLYARWMGTLWWHLPAVGTAVLNRSQDIVLFGAAALGAVGLDWLLRAPPARCRRRVREAAAVSGTAVVLLVIFALQLRHNLTAGRPPGHRVTVANDLVRVHLTTELVLALLFFGALWIVVTGRVGTVRLGAGLGAAVLAFAANGMVMRSYNTSVSTRLAYPVTSTIRSLQHAVGHGETLFADGTFPWADVNLWYGLSDVGSFDPLAFPWHADLYHEVFHTRSVGENDRMPQCLSGLQLFGVRAVVGGDGRFAGSGPPLQATGTVGGAPYFAVPGSSLLAVVGRHVTAPGDAAALGLAEACGFDPGAMVILDNSSYHPADRTPTSAFSGRNPRSATARLGSGTPDDERVTVKTSAPAYLVVRQTWAPGWHVTVDGVAAELFRADVAFDAVAVPAGTHRVELTYEAPGLLPGELVSLLALLALTAGMALRWPWGQGSADRRQNAIADSRRVAGRRSQGPRRTPAGLGSRWPPSAS
ncbi:MAG: YfhO family protein [Acidimicrobiales bacterium]